MLLKIRQVGEPVLRQPTRELTVEEIRHPALGPLIAQMRATMEDAPGVGLAAPQIGLNLRLAVVQDDVEGVPQAALDERERKPVPFQVLINPRLTIVDPTPVEFFEGCLSLDGYTAIVARARAVQVEALDERGEPVSFQAQGWYARILQHEIDHLDGTLYIDRMQTRSLSSTSNHERYLAHHSIPEVKALLKLP